MQAVFAEDLAAWWSSLPAPEQIERQLGLIHGGFWDAETSQDRCTCRIPIAPIPLQTHLLWGRCGEALLQSLPAGEGAKTPKRSKLFGSKYPECTLLLTIALCTCARFKIDRIVGFEYPFGNA